MESISINSHPRLRVRRVDEKAVIGCARADARTSGKPVIQVGHGGDVANAYKWPAETETILVVAFPNGDVWGEVNRVPANKVTLAGAAEAAIPEARPLFDGRYGKAKKDKARGQVLAAVREWLHPSPPPAPLSGWDGFPLGGPENNEKVSKKTPEKE